MKDKDAYLEQVRKGLAQEAEDPLEGMSDFFTAQVGSYENHMLGLFPDCREAVMRGDETITIRDQPKTSVVR